MSSPKHEIDGKVILIEKARPKGSPIVGVLHNTEAGKLFVGGLGACTPAELRATFAKFGTVLKVQILTDHITSKRTGYGFVTLSSRAEAARALQATDGQTTLTGAQRPVQVSYASERKHTGAVPSYASPRCASTESRPRSDSPDKHDALEGLQDQHVNVSIERHMHMHTRMYIHTHAHVLRHMFTQIARFKRFLP